ncbi:hypothetical protein S83_034722 [Arachis hypogaea]
MLFFPRYALQTKQKKVKNLRTEHVRRQQNHILKKHTQREYKKLQCLPYEAPSLERARRNPRKGSLARPQQNHPQDMDAHNNRKRQTVAPKHERYEEKGAHCQRNTKSSTEEAASQHMVTLTVAFDSDNEDNEPIVKRMRQLFQYMGNPQYQNLRDAEVNLN